jgi:Protein of unknown function (DUF3684)
LLEWTRFIAEHPDLELSAPFAEKVLGVISRAWPALESSRRALVVSLEKKRCIPTKFGMEIPCKAYFTTVQLFPDLPIINFIKPYSEKILLALGVRKVRH